MHFGALPALEKSELELFQDETWDFTQNNVNPRVYCGISFALHLHFAG
jgi:hypothetical protein